MSPNAPVAADGGTPSAATGALGGRNNVSDLYQITFKRPQFAVMNIKSAVLNISESVFCRHKNDDVRLYWAMCPKVSKSVVVRNRVPHDPNNAITAITLR